MANTFILVFGNIPNIFATFFKELALITIREMWGLGLELPGLGLDLGFYGKVSVSKFEPGVGLDNISGFRNLHGSTVPLQYKVSWGQFEACLRQNSTRTNR